mgnify:CR=1 FL=1
MINLPAVLRPSDGGPALDECATAQDVSVSGFTLETQAELSRDEAFLFMLELPDGGRVSGAGRVTSVKKGAFAARVEIKVTRISWRDKRLLARALDPDVVDWSKVMGLAIKAIFALTVITAARKLRYPRPDVRAGAGQRAPTVIALRLMGWSLLALLRRDRR